MQYYGGDDDKDDNIRNILEIQSRRRKRRGGPNQDFLCHHIHIMYSALLLDPCSHLLILSLAVTRWWRIIQGIYIFILSGIFSIFTESHNFFFSKHFFCFHRSLFPHFALFWYYRPLIRFQQFLNKIHILILWCHCNVSLEMHWIITIYQRKTFRGAVLCKALPPESIANWLDTTELDLHLIATWRWWMMVWWCPLTAKQ